MLDSAGKTSGRRAATLHDVARHVGVSARTVSRVVNDEGGFSESTRHRVLAAVTELAYRPNVHARQLISGRSGSIALLAPTLSDPFFPELAEGAQRRAHDAGLMVLLSMSDGDVDTQTEVLTMLEGHHLNGIVVFPVGPVEQLTPFLDRGVQMVVVDTVVTHPNAASVLSDLEGGTRAAVQRLVDRGCRRLAMINNASEPMNQQRRSRAFVDAVPPGIDHLMLGVAPNLDGGRAAGEQLVHDHPDVDGIFVYNDMMAIGAMQALQRNGRSIPDDIAVIGCDDVQVASVTSPGLTTIRIDRERLGREAVDTLIALADAQPVESVRVLPIELVVRDSG